MKDTIMGAAQMDLCSFQCMNADLVPLLCCVTCKGDRDTFLVRLISMYPSLYKNLSVKMLTVTHFTDEAGYGNLVQSKWL